MTVLRNGGRWDASNAVYRDGRVVALRQARAAAGHALDRLRALGAHARRRWRATRPTWPRSSPGWPRPGSSAGYEATERFYEIGTPEALAETDAFLRAWKSRVRSSTKLTTVTHAATPKKTSITGRPRRRQHGHRRRRDRVLADHDRDEARQLLRERELRSPSGRRKSKRAVEHEVRRGRDDVADRDREPPRRAEHRRASRS